MYKKYYCYSGEYSDYLHADLRRRHHHKSSHCRHSIRHLLMLMSC